MNQKLYDLIEANPVIAAVKDMEGLDACCQRDEIKVVFILLGISAISAPSSNRLKRQTKWPWYILI